jgi:hypothetical protein
MPHAFPSAPKLAGNATEMRLLRADRYLADWRQRVRDTLDNDAI